MKKRICFVGFVDDKTDTLKSLKQALSGISSAWDCTFVSSGARALAAMANTPFDAAVTQMHLEGMTGAELLQAVGKLHPATLRFVIGDVADQELIFNGIGATYQFIARPCEHKTLIATIQRSLALGEWLSSDALRALVPRLGRLPSPPSTYFQILKAVESPNSTVQSVGQVIARDPAVTARLLQMVNSAPFAREQKVTNPVQAVSLLGVETVKSLVLCLQVFSQNDSSKKAGVSLDPLWDHSASVANIARDIALRQPDGKSMADAAFTAGLLHDVGRIVLAENLPQDYAKVVAAARTNSQPLLEEESKQFGTTHAQVGAYLLGLWGMPAAVVEAAALHHTPGKASTRECSLLSAVHIANVFAHETDGGTEAAELPKLDLDYLKALGLADKTDGWRRAMEKAKPVTAPKPAPLAVKSTPPPIPLPQASKATPPPIQSSPPPVRVVVTAHAAAKQNNWLALALAPVAVLIIAATLFWWFERSGSPVRARTAGKDASPAPLSREELRAKLAAAAPPVAAVSGSTETNAAQMALIAAKRALDSVRVQGIFYRARNPSVIINGKTLVPGEKINDVVVVAIGQSSVTLESGGQQRVVRVK